MTPDIRQVLRAPLVAPASSQRGLGVWRARSGSKKRSCIQAVIFGLGIVILSLGLAACTPGSSTGAGQTPTAPQQCGSVQITEGLQKVSSNATQAENCFWQAYQQCQTATLMVTMMGIDAGTTRTFALSPNGNACKVQDTVQYYVVPKGNSPAKTYTCAGLTQPRLGGLLFTACGADGNVTVPPPTS